jgi:hypothetical protein
MASPATARTAMQVTIIPQDLVQALMASTACLDLPKEIGVKLLTKLAVAQKAFKHGFPRMGANRLKLFIIGVEAQHGSTLTDQDANLLIG